MKVKKPTSKRVSVKLREGIKKKAAAHNRKERKMAKKDVTWKSKVKKDPGIPNSFPFKNRILEQIELERQRKAEEQQKRKVDAQTGAQALVDVEMDNDEMAHDQVDPSDRLAALMESVQAAEGEYNDRNGDNEDDDDDDEEEELEGPADTSRKAFDSMAKDVIDDSDVVLYVLDARNPLGTRSKEIEQAVLAKPDKRLIFVLNKIDLIPPETLKDWRAHLELLFPTIAVAASTGAPRAIKFKHKGLSQANTAAALMQSLKRYAARANLKRAVTVGVVGYPNVGKSSVINSLVSRNGLAKVACPVGSQAGVTTTTRKIKVDNKLSIWDSPGVVFPSETTGGTDGDKHARLVLLNSLPPKQIGDPLAPVSLLLKRLLSQPEQFDRLQSTYDLPPMVHTPHSKFVSDFLVHVARKLGRIGRHGVPDTYSAAMAVLNDWRDGRVAGWALPPKVMDERLQAKESHSEVSNQVQIVSGWAQEFNLGQLWDELEKD